PNFEAKPGYSFTVVATDAAGNTAERAVTLAVSNVDEVGPSFTSSSTATAVAENTAANTVVYTAAATDSDFNSPATASSVSYSLKANTGDATQFSINSATGAVTLTESPNFEAKPGYSFTVVATDAAGNTAERAVTLAVSNVNDAPVLASMSTLGFTENDAATSINTAITVVDLDNPSLASATVSITAGFESNQDVLGFVNDGTSMGNIAGSWDSATGVMSLSSSGATATLAQWQAALRAVNYSNTSDNPTTAARTVSYVVNDGAASSNVLTSTVNVTALNDAPVLANGSTLAYTENAAAEAINTAITVADADNARLASAAVSISGGFVAGQDVLGFVADSASMGNIAGTWDSATGVMSLSSAGETATLAQWQAALRAVSYSNTSDSPNTAARTVSYVVNDGTTASAAVTSSINVTALNDAPVLTNGSTLSYAENTAAAVVNTAITVTDADNMTLASATVSITGGFSSDEDALGFANDGSTMGNIAAAYDSNTGALTLTSSDSSATLSQWQAALRAVTYRNTSDNPSTAVRTVSYVVNDGINASTAITSSINVTGVNDAPVLNGTASLVYPENANATAIHSDIMVDDADHTTLTSATVSITAGYASGQDVLGFVNDASTGNITGSFNSISGVMTLSSSGGTASLAQWQSALRAVTYRNTSANPSTAERTVSYVVNDGLVNSNAVSATITLTGANDAPVNTLPKPANGLEDFEQVITGLQVTDVDAGETTMTVTLGVSSGTLSVLASQTVSVSGNNSSSVQLIGVVSEINALLASAGALTFKPEEDVYGSVTLTMTTSDGTLSDSDSVSFTLSSVNDAPSGTSATITLAEDTSKTFSAADFGFTDAADSPANALSAVIITTLPTAGSLTFNGTPVTVGQSIAVANIGSLLFTPASNANGLAYASLAFKVQDDGGTANNGVNTSSSESTLSIDVTAFYDAPVNTVPGAQTVAEDTSLAITGLSVNDVDGNLATTRLTVSNGSLSVSLSAGASISAGANSSSTLTLSGTQSQINAALATVTYQGNTNFNGSDTLTMLSTDASSTPLSDSDTVAISVTAVNDAPVLAGVSTLAYTENDAAVAIHTAITVADVDHSSLSAATVSITGGFVAGEDVLSFVGDSASMGNIAGSWDSANGVMSLSSAGGTATLVQWQTALSAVQYSNSSDKPSTAARTVSYVVNDGSSTSNTITANINITAVNDQPATESLIFKGLEDNGGVNIATAPVPTGAMGSRVSDLVTILASGNDADNSALGVAFTSVLSTSANGKLWYSTDNGATWTDLSTLSLSQSNALILGSHARLYFQGSANVFGSVATANMRLWDGTDGASSGSLLDITGLHGNSGAYSASNSTLTFNLTAVNDEPEFTATSVGVRTNQTSSLPVFSTSSAHPGNAPESAQKFQSLSLTVQGVQDGSSEKLLIDGTDIALVAGTAGPSTHGWTATVSVAGGSVTITLSNADGASASELQTLVDGVRYTNAHATPTDGDRVIQITSVQDNGGTGNGGDDAAALNMVSTITLDTTAPTAVPTITAIHDNVGTKTGTVLSGAKTDDTALSLSGTLDVPLALGESLRIYDGTILLGTANVTGTGWTFADTRTLTDGQTVTYKALAYDGLNEGAASANYSATVDLTPPVITITAIAGDVLTVTGSDSTGIGTYSASERGTDPSTVSMRPVISGTTDAEVGQTVTLALNGQTHTASVLAGTAGLNTWSVELSNADALALNHGSTLDIVATVTDQAGHSGSDTNNKLRVNTAAPDIPTVENKLSGITTPTLTGTALKAVPGTPVTYAPLATGDTLAITINSVTLTVTIGTVTPGFGYDASTGQWTLNTGAVTTSFSLSDNTTYDVALSATASDVTKTDASTNELRIKTAAPVITLATISGDNLIDASEANTPLAISGTTDAEIGSTVTVIGLDGTPRTALVAAGASGQPNVFTITVPAAAVAGLADNNYTVTASVVNAYGVSGSGTRSVKVDLVAPTTTAGITAVTDDVGEVTGVVANGGRTDDTRPGLSGTLSANLASDEVVQVYDGTTYLGVAMVTGTGWTFTDPRTLLDGQKVNYTAVVFDGANLGTPSSTYSATLDLTPPNAANDTVSAVEAGGTNNASAGTNPTGNVLQNDSAGPSDSLSLKSVTGAGSATAVAVNGSTSIVGSFGTLSMSANGSYTYTVDQRNASVQALNAGSSAISDVFTYTVHDVAGLSSTATLTVAVNGANDAPVLASMSTLGFTENDAATSINTAITVVDLDNPSLASATVSITAGFESNQDVLGFVNDGTSMGNIAGSWDSATGVMSLSSSGATATLAQWQAALRAVNYSNTSDNPTTAARTVSYVVNDGAASSNVLTSTVNVTALNDAPVLANGSTLAYTENAAAEAINTAITVADVDNARLASAAVSISGGFVAGQDVLSFTNTGAAAMGNITGSYNSATGVMSLSSAGATATLAQWQAALRAVAYSNTSDSPNTSSRTVSYVVNDGTVASAAVTSTITLQVVNDAPVLADTALALSAVGQDAADPSGAVGTLVSSLVGGQSDVDSASAPKGIAITGVNTYGTLYYSTDGGSTWTAVSGASGTNALLLGADSDNRIFFKPNAGYYGTLSDAVTFRAWDQSSGLEGSYVSTATTGGSSAFSTATDTISQQVVRPVTINTVSTDSIVVLNEAVPLSGTADANATVSLDINGKARTVVADADGNWTYDTKLVPLVRYVMVRKENSIFTVAELKVMVDGVDMAAGKAVTYGIGKVEPGAILNTLSVLTDGDVGSYHEANVGAGSEAWVEVDLGGYFRVDTIQVTQRNGWADRLNGAKISTSLTQQSLLSPDELQSAATATPPTVGITTVSGLTSDSYWQVFTATQPNATNEDPFINGANVITATQTVSSVSSSDTENVTWQTTAPGADGTVPVFSSGTTASVAENTSTTTTVYDAQATDAGAGNDVGIIYSLGGSDAARFDISSTGLVTFKLSPDFELPSDLGGNNVYNIILTAKDASNNAAYQNVAITVTNVDEVGPTFSSSATATGVNENSAANTVVYTATATDTDFNSPATANSITYSLKPGVGDVAKFSIGSTTGSVTLTESPDFEVKSSYSFTVVATDAANNTSERVVTLAVNNVNEVPVNTVPGAQTVAEDTLLAITGLSVQDVDGNLATTRLTVSNGSLSVSLAAGASISAGANSSSTLTLSGTQSQINAALATVTYQGNASFNGSDTLTVFSTDSGGIPLSDSDTVGITVTAANDAPVLADTSLVFTAVAQDASAPTGTVGGLVGSFLGGSTDADASHLKGLAITGVNNGTLYFSTNGGTSWTAVSGASDANALLLGSDNDNRLYFKPNPGFYGTASDAVTFRAWDQTSGSEGSYASTATNGGSSAFSTATDSIAQKAVRAVTIDTVSGDNQVTNSETFDITGVADALATVTVSVNGTTLTATADANGHWSMSASGSILASGANVMTATEVVQGITLSDTETVTVVNGRPDFGNANAINMAAVLEDAAVPASADTTSGTAVSGYFVNIADNDIGAVKGLAITGVNTNGTLYYSTNIGASWQMASGLSESNALHLDGNSRVFFKPNANWNGTLTDALQYRAWDQSNGVIVGALATTDSGAASTSAYSAAVRNSGITVTSVNDAPSGTSATITLAEDTSKTFSAADFGFTDAADSPANALSAVIITTLPTAGSLTFNGTPVTVGQSIAVANIGSLLFTPASNANGLAYASLAFKVQDDGGTANNGVNTSSSESTLSIDVTAFYDAPVNTVPGAQTVAEDTSLAITGLSVNDVDGNLATTRLTVSNGSLSVSLSAGASISAGANSSSTLTLSGTQSQINAALATVTYQGNTNFNGSDTLTMLSTDASSTPLSDSDTVAISVTAVNDAPVLAGVSTLAYTENDAAVAIHTAITVADVDHSSLSAATVSITGGFVAGEDVLSFVGDSASMGNIAGSWDSANGVMSLSSAGGTATLVQWQTALSAVQYSNSSDKPSTAARTVSYVVSDGSSTSNTITASINITAVNDAPVNTVPLAQTTAEDTPLVITGLSVNDADAGFANITVTLSLTQGTGSLTVQTSGSNVTRAEEVSGGQIHVRLTGTVADINAVLAAANGVTYTPSANFNGSTTLTVTSNDGGNTGGSSLTDTETVGITVTAVNDAPVNLGMTAKSTNEDTSKAISGLQISDVDAGSSTMTVTLAVTHGTLTLLSATGVTVTDNNSASVQLSGTVTDINALLATANAVTYVPPANFNGSATLSMTTSDGTLSDTDTVSITVNAVNDAPVNTVPGPQTTAEDTPLVITGIQIADVDAGSSTMTVTLAVTHGTLTLASGTGVTLGTNNSASVTLSGTLSDINAFLATANAVTYVPTAHYNGSATLSITTSDGTHSDTDTVGITVTAVNDPATIGGVTSGTLTETNAAQSTSGTLTIADIDSPTTFSAQTNTAGSGGYGSFSLATDGVWTYTMNSAHDEFVGGQTYTDSFTAVAADGTTQVVTVTIAGTNDAAVIGGATSGTLTETDAVQSTTGSLTISDVDSAQTFAAQTGTAGSNGYGSFNVSTNGAWTYTLNSAQNQFAAGQDYTDSFTVTSADGTTQVVTVTISGSNDAAVIGGDTTATLTESNEAQSTTGTLTISDVDSPQTFAAQSNTSGSGGYGNFTLTTAGVWTYTMNSAHNQFVAGQTYTDSFTAVAADGTTQVITVSITGSNDAPVLTTGSTLVYTENSAATPINTVISVSDADHSTLASATVSISSGFDSGQDVLSFTNTGAAAIGNITGSYNSATGVMSLSSAGATATLAQWQAALRAVAYSNTSDSPNTSSRTVSYVVNDGTVASAAVTSTITLQVVNDAPVLADTALALSAVGQDAADPSGAVGTLVSSLVGGQSDVDSASAPKGIAITGVNTYGTLYYSTDGGSTWTAVSGASGTNALLLGADSDNRIFFKPNAGYYGTLSDAVTFRAWDQSSGLEGSYVSTATTGGSSAFSTATDTISQQVVRPVTINTVSTDSIVVLNEAVPLSGTADANATVSLDINGKARTVVADVDGNWTYDTKLVPLVRYVMVRKDMTGDYFAMSEVKVWVDGVNIAAGKAVAMGTGTVQPGAVLDNTTALTDNNVNSYHEVYGASGSEVWVELDLGDFYRVDSIQVSQRSSWSDRLNGSKVSTSLTQQSLLTSAQLQAASTATPPTVGITTVSGLTPYSYWETFTATQPNATNEDPFINGANVITATQNVSSVSSSDTENVTWQATAPGVDGTAPVFSSGTTASVAENISTTTTVYDAQATDAGAGNDVGITYSLSGTDAARFTINASTGVVKFVASPNFEVPTDNGANNVYDVIVEAKDAANNTVYRNVAITVTNINDAPTGTSNSITIDEDGSKTFAASDFGFTDATGESHTLSAVIITTLPTAGTLTLSGTAVTLNQSIAVANLGSLVYSPAQNANGNAYATIGFKVQDNGGTANGGTDTSVNANTLTFNVSGVNDAPVVNTATALSLAGVSEDAGVPSGSSAGTAVSELFAAITDADVGHTKSVAITGVNSNGKLYFSADGGSSWQEVTTTLSESNALHLDGNSRVYFRPNANWNGTLSDAIQFRAWDQTSMAIIGSTSAVGTTGGSGAYSTVVGSVGITVSAVNDAPVNTVPVA
ncbi:tandem-95 repeat protein, partial [Limnohabitans sp.]|uniref:tandem-95 repeat protein n=1 Tax=Limnohabitans sp. TaxID=1907725 RepID=UPI0031FD5A3C